jgi:hypothetical protein
MPGGSGRKVIAAQAGAAFPGALVAAAAGKAATASAKQIPTVIELLIAGFPRLGEMLALYSGDPPLSRVNSDCA